MIYKAAVCVADEWSAISVQGTSEEEKNSSEMLCGKGLLNLFTLIRKQANCNEQLGDNHSILNFPMNPNES